MDRLRLMFWSGMGGATLAALAGMAGFHDASIWRMPGALEARVEAALQAGGHGGIDVRMNGQQAVLRAIVADAGAISAATAAALHAAGPGGPWAGGVTSVDASGLSVGPVVRPFAWRMRREGGRGVLSGVAPSEAARADLLAAAATAFPNAEIIDDMQAAGGAPSPNWTEMARNVIRALATLNQGEGRMTNTQIALIGDGEYAAVERLRADYAAPPAPFRASVTASVDGLDLVYAQLQGLDLRDGDASACAQALTRLSEGPAIAFAQATIAPSSTAALEGLASVALRCDRNLIVVRGPAQGGGDLSRQRAAAVADFFAAQGVLREQLQLAAGDGEGVAFAVIPVSGSSP